MLTVWLFAQATCAAVLVLLLATAAVQAQPPQGNREQGQAPEACYNSALSNETARVLYTRSAGPRETTFIFLVSLLGSTL